MRDGERGVAPSNPASPGRADGSASMQKFIEQSISCILHPIAEHVNLLQRGAEQLMRNGAALDERMEEVLTRLQRHDQLFLETEVSLAQKVDVVRLRQEVTQMGYDKRVCALEAGQRALQDSTHSLDQRLEGADGQMQAVKTSQDECEANLHRLQLKIWQNATMIQRLESTVGEVKDETCNLGQRHHGLVRTIRKTREDLEIKTSNIAKGHSELENRHAEVGKLLAETHTHIVSMKEFDKDLASWQGTQNELTSRIHKELDKIRADLGNVDETCHRLLDTGRDAANIVRRLASMEETISKAQKAHDADMRQLTHGMETIAEEVRVQAQDTVDCFGTMRGLEAAKRSVEERMENVERQFVDMVNKQDRITKRTDNHDLTLKTVQVAQKEVERRIDENCVEVDQVRSAQQRASTRQSEMDVAVHAFKAELGLTTEGVAKIAAHLDLAHDYLHGLSRGFQQKSIAAQDALPQPPTKVTSRSAGLPTLSTPRPRPLSAAVPVVGLRPQSAGRFRASEAAGTPECTSFCAPPQSP